MYKGRLALLALLVALSLCAGAWAESAPEATAAPSAAPTAEPAPTARPFGPDPQDGTLRVWLQSLGRPDALGLTLEGAYTVDGDRGFQFEPGTEVALGMHGGSIVLKVGGATIDMGLGFTLTRHLDAEGNAGGLLIHESEKNTAYNGDVTFTAGTDGLRVVVAIDIEEYLYGVVPYEMSDEFPLEALKAQAVAARTYAMQRKTRTASAGRDYDVVDTTNDQVYKGFDARYKNAVRAVDETRGLVGMYKGSYAECFYSASNGGQTALATDVWGSDGDFAYLDMRDDPYDLKNMQSRVKTARVVKDASAMNDALYRLLIGAVSRQLVEKEIVVQGEAVGITTVENIEAINPIYGGESRQYGTVRFTLQVSVQHFHPESTELFRYLGEEEALKEPVVVELSFYDEVRQALDLTINSSKYDMLTVEAYDGGFKLTSRRYGHGVGMSQRGAQQMAGKNGMTHLDILNFYYPGMELVQIEWLEQALTPVDALPESLGYAAPRPTPAPTPAPLPALQGQEYYAVVRVDNGTDGTLNVREGPSIETELLGTLRNGQRLIVTEETGEGWAKMKTVEIEGYVSMDFLEKE